MYRLSRFLIALSFALALFNPVGAQEQTPAVANMSAPTVTATATDTRVRFSAPAGVVQLRLEVYDETGRKVYDTEQRGGSVLDWHLADGQGERVAAGTYACVLTVKSLSGRLTQRLAAVTVAAQTAAVQSVAAAQLAPVVQQAVGPVAEDAALVVLKEGEAAPATLLAHDSTDGQLTRTRGALRFTVGDFFAGLEREQMRLTADGDLGIGTKQPQARLDVVGDIRLSGFMRAAKGIEFADGTVQTTGLSGRTDKDGNIVPAAAGTGTQGRLAKWTDNAGTLGDSVITELNTNIGISNPNPTAKLVVDAASGAQLRFDKGIAGVTPVLSVISQPSSTTQGGASILGAGTGGSSFVFSDNLPFFLVRDTKANVLNNNLGSGTVLFTLLPTGEVGIGTTSPTNKLEVAGNLKLTGTGNGLIFPDGTKQTTAATGGGGGVSGTGTANTVPLWTGASALANSVITQAGANIGIGTAAPGKTLDVNGTARFAPGGSGGTVEFGPAGGETGMAVISSTFNTRADVRFDGGSLKLLAGLGTGAPPSTNGVVVTTLGNVGIGNAAPSNGRLHVSGGAGQPAVYGTSANRGVWGVSTGSSYGVYGESVSGIGMQGVSDTNIGVGGISNSNYAVAGTSTSSIGVRGETAATSITSPGVQGISTGTGGVGVRGDGTTGVYGVSTSGVGVTGESASGFAMYANGNAGQARDKGGFVKAMLYVNPSGAIVRCYNGVTGASTGTCGFNVTRVGLGEYDIVPGFQVDDRFLSVTAENGVNIIGADDNLGANFTIRSATTIRVSTFVTDQPQNLIDDGFMLIIY